ncbi:MAG: GNAT family N-acetyltransferase [Candidatus Eremiobacterota bacterium]
MNFTIRPATKEDYRGICDVFTELDSVHHELLPEVYRESQGPARSEEYIFSIIDNEEAAIFVAESDKEIIGLVHIYIQETPPLPIVVPQRYSMIDNLIVKSKFRHSDAGRILIEKAHEWSSDKGVKQVALVIWEFNRGAIEFYEKIGYRTVSRRMGISLNDDNLSRSETL